MPKETRSYNFRDCALLVACSCGAVQGSPCYFEDGTSVVPVHEERVETMRAIVNSGIMDYDAEGLRP